MGTTKHEKFLDKHNHIAKVAKALSHPARVAIIDFIMRQDSCICGDIVEELPLSQSTVSQHLKELKEVGLVKGEIDGPKTCYCIDEQAWNNAKVLLEGFFELPAIKKCC